MDEDTIPLEAGIESRAISFSKGCYVGQEVIIGSFTAVTVGLPVSSPDSSLKGRRARRSVPE